MPRNEVGSGRRLCLPIEQWPEADRVGWRKAIQDAGPFGRNSTASAWAEATRAGTVFGYGRWLGWASEKGFVMNGPPADRVTPSRVQAYIADLRRINGDFTVLRRVQSLYDAIRVIEPDRNWHWLLRIQSALDSRSVPVRDKRTYIRPTAELVKLGKTLMRAAENAKTKPPLKRAILFRDGLMIAFLACRPLRLSNLAMMTLDRHLIRQTSGYRLYFNGREVKGGKPIETNVPASLVGNFDRYLDHYRPILLTRGGRRRPRECDALWISRIAAPLNYKAIPDRVAKHTRAAFGKHLWVHLFRHCAATTIATEDPTHVRSIIAILGHSTLATSEKYYHQAQSLEASRRYHQILADWLKSFDENGAREV
jgi:site-specific recombinase XerD